MTDGEYFVWPEAWATTQGRTTSTCQRRSWKSLAEALPGPSIRSNSSRRDEQPAADEQQ